mmetsp:Transcript_9022/g.15468  ORF Transcript_9022/g.15468 Transcript_9022/m.15468 type:complete len:213 (+) Transcript_9022:331-969(+)
MVRVSVLEKLGLHGRAQGVDDLPRDIPDALLKRRAGRHLEVSVGGHDQQHVLQRLRHSLGQVIGAGGHVLLHEAQDLHPQQMEVLQTRQLRQLLKEDSGEEEVGADESLLNATAVRRRAFSNAQQLGENRKDHLVEAGFPGGGREIVGVGVEQGALKQNEGVVADVGPQVLARLAEAFQHRQPHVRPPVRGGLLGMLEVERVGVGVEGIQHV